MITLHVAESICSRGINNSQEVDQLRELQMHIIAFEDGSNKRVEKLYRLIDEAINDFFGFSDDMFNI